MKLLRLKPLLRFLTKKTRVLDEQFIAIIEYIPDGEERHPPSNANL